MKAAAIRELDRLRGGSEARPELDALLQQISSVLRARAPEYPRTARATNVYAKDKLTYEATATKNHCLDLTISELELDLDPKKIIRIHRSTIVNASYAHEFYSWFAGRMLLRLKDEKKTELTVAPDRVKSHLGI